MTVTVEGADRLAATMRAAAGELADMGAVHAAVGSMIAGRVSPPRLTGRLAGSIRSSSTPRDVVVGSNLVYAPVHEYGWPAHNIRARRYLASAFAGSINTALDQYGQAVADAVRKVKGA